MGFPLREETATTASGDTAFIVGYMDYITYSTSRAQRRSSAQSRSFFFFLIFVLVRAAMKQEYDVGDEGWANPLPFDVGRKTTFRMSPRFLTYFAIARTRINHCRLVPLEFHRAPSFSGADMPESFTGGARGGSPRGRSLIRSPLILMHPRFSQPLMRLALRSIQRNAQTHRRNKDGLRKIHTSGYSFPEGMLQD